jgi:hypothetical protein
MNESTRDMTRFGLLRLRRNEIKAVARQDLNFPVPDTQAVAQRGSQIRTHGRVHRQQL